MLSHRCLAFFVCQVVPVLILIILLLGIGFGAVSFGNPPLYVPRGPVNQTGWKTPFIAILGADQVLPLQRLPRYYWLARKILLFHCCFQLKNSFFPSEKRCSERRYLIGKMFFQKIGDRNYVFSKSPPARRCNFQGGFRLRSVESSGYDLGGEKIPCKVSGQWWHGW